MSARPPAIYTPARHEPRPPAPRVAGFATPRLIAAWRSIAIIVVTLSTLIQLILFFDLENLRTSFLLALGNLLGLGYSLRQAALRRYPISTLMILGYTVSYFSLPPIGQLIGFNSVTHNLDHALIDIFYAVIGLLAIIAGHIIYRQSMVLGKIRNTMRTQFYQRIGFFREPRIAQLWIMGLAGALGLLLSRPDTLEDRSVVEALMAGFRPFVYLPYLMLLLPAWTERRSVSRTHTAFLWFYTALLLILSFIANSRAYLLVGFTSLGIMYFYMVLVGRVPVPRVRLRSLVLALVALALVTGPIAKLSKSMVLVRGERTDLSPAQLASATWNTFLQEDVTTSYDALWALYAENPDSRVDYFDNLFLNRLGNLRFVDLAVTNSQRLGPGGAERFAETEAYKTASILPAPLLRLILPDVDKRWYTSGSSGDFLLYEATGNAYAIGNFQTGSILVNLKLTFGMMWPLVLALLAAALFAVTDALCKPERRGATGSQWNRFNPLVVGSLFTYTVMLTSAATGTDGLAGLVGPVLRGWIQIGILYAIAFHASRLLTLATRRRQIRP